MTLSTLYMNTPQVYIRMHGESIQKKQTGLRSIFAGSYIRDDWNVKIWKTGYLTLDYITQIGFADINKGKDSDVMVHCTCPYFQYWLEVVMTRRRASFIYNSTPEWPVMKNPSGKLYLCKHLFFIVRPTLMMLKKETVTKSPTKLLTHPFLRRER